MEPLSARMALGLGIVLLIPALVSLVSAIHSAASTGEVLVLFIGRTDGKVESVPWPLGWARFVGPVLLLAATVLGIASPRWSSRWFIACAASGLGVAMLLESWFFTTIAGSLIAVGVFSGVPLLAAGLSKERAPL